MMKQEEARNNRAAVCADLLFTLCSKKRPHAQSFATPTEQLPYEESHVRYCVRYMTRNDYPIAVTGGGTEVELTDVEKAEETVWEIRSELYGL